MMQPHSKIEQPHAYLSQNYNNHHFTTSIPCPKTIVQKPLQTQTKMDKFDKLKLASSSFTDKLKTSSAQMKDLLKDLLNTPTPESKLVDEATLETLEEPNWGLNLRICSMINGDEISGSEVVKALKRKVVGKSVVSQRLSLELMEACTTNCDRVSSEVASEKVVEELVKMIEDTKVDQGNRVRAMQLIRAWGESKELEYLPIFRQTYESLKTKVLPSETPANLESYFEQQPLSPPPAYPVPPMGMQDEVPESFVAYSFQTVEEKKEFLVISRNSLEILSSILNTEGEPKPIKDKNDKRLKWIGGSAMVPPVACDGNMEELTVSMYEKCKHSLPVMQRIIQSTSDDEVMMFDALNLHDELQQITSKYEELAAALEPESPNISVAEEQQEGSDTKEAKPSTQDEKHTSTDKADSLKEEKTESSSVPKSTGQALQDTTQHEAQL
ncbi:hypothetical protein LIER_35706 [Lithospermum erythrorhizon]|uniref:Uncharacterized protein n=1 Tax=Lithospermum erythrorhizon TaxID=34254 RepID=A0AAV3NV72_LITER